MIPVVCSNCDTRILVPPTVQGSRGICFKCGGPIEVPMAQSTANELLQFEHGELVAGRYRIDKALGRGGMGVVYGATDTLVDEVVALKFMRPDRLSKPGARMLFIREAQVARRLRHDHIAAVHDVGVTLEDILYLSMELLEGQTLRDYLRTRRESKGHIPVRTAVQFMGQILSALEYAHRTVYHRDMKPENVIVLPGEQLKIVDFGLARAVDGDSDLDPLPSDPNKPRALAGTAAYAAPEQKLHHTLDHRVDIYAAGKMFAELLTLRTPLENKRTLSEIRSDVAPGLLRVYEKATQEKREDRFASAQQFREAMESAYAEAYGEKIRVEHSDESKRDVDTSDMVRFDGGAFIMGNDDERTEAPAHEVEAAPFYMDIHPVTNESYEYFCKATGHRPSKFEKDPRYNGARQPVVGISFEDAAAYAAWAGKQLPTEIQWEFAARGRSQRKYPWGSAQPDGIVANYGEHVGSPSIVTLHDDGATPEGLLDMAGNVYEWTRDPFAPYVAIRENKPVAQTEPRRACRGGAWNSSEDTLRSTHRQGFFPDTQAANLGFRCVVEIGDDVPS